MFTRLYSHYHCLIPEHFHLPTKKPHARELSLPIFHAPQPLATTDLPSVYESAFSEHFTNRTSQYGAFCDWHFSRSLTLSGLIHVVMCVVLHSLCGQDCSIGWMPHIWVSIHQSMGMWVVSTAGLL